MEFRLPLIYKITVFLSLNEFWSSVETPKSVNLATAESFNSILPALISLWIILF